MKVQLLMTAAVALLIAAEPSREDAGKKADKARILGQWKVMSAVTDGKESKEAELKSLGWKWVFKDDKFRWQFLSVANTEWWAYRLDQDKKPKQIDLQLTDEKKKEVTWKGIYALEGDEQKVCVNETGGGKSTAEIAA